ncbi:MAG: VanZ family protein [Candidatus Fimadaptatus sp.]
MTFYTFVVLAMVLGLPIASHQLRRRPSVFRYVNLLLLGIYLFANLYLTLLSRQAGPFPKVELTPLWSYRAALGGDDSLREEVILNILLYVPLGYLLHYAFPKLGWWQVILTGFVMSVLTETAQLVFRLGLCEVDDLISNTLGTVIGVGAYRAYKRFGKGEGQCGGRVR